MSCKHISNAELRVPSPSQSVYREDCTQCFDSIDEPEGLSVCLYCFNGGCAGDRKHSALHYQSLKHPLVVNIKRSRKKIKRDEPPQKLSKLAIVAETEEDRYDTITRIDCFECNVQGIEKSSGRLAPVVDGILKANTFARQEEVKAWEQEITACEHTLCLDQEAARAIESQDLGHCASCELKENLWLCLTCGNLGCGRSHFGGLGGNSHALGHAAELNHPVAVKLGSLTADGTADVYCYSCNDECLDPELATHLSHWGIDIAGRQKTEKSLTEMQIEHNFRWDFSMTTEDGKDLKPLFGPEFTGLKNLGNSCYLASVIQCLFSMPEFASRYYLPHDMAPAALLPAEDLETQLRKIADGLISGRYSHPDADVVVAANSSGYQHQKGLAPAMLKYLIGKGHVEFSTMRQQDAFELLLHLLQLISRSKHSIAAQNPVDSFKFIMEQRLQCLNCKRVRYRTDEMENISIPVPIRRIPNALTAQQKAETSVVDKVTAGNKEGKKEKEEFEPVTIQECLDNFTTREIVDLTCPSCQSKTGFSKQSLFKTFPTVLVINARRFELVNWLPTKQDVPVIVNDEPFAFDAYKAFGLQDDEIPLPEDAPVVKAAQGNKFAPNEAAMAQLEEMGFPRVRCIKALKATGNTDAETASMWLFEHMEDPDIDVPEEISAGGVGPSVDQSQIDELGNMGFSAPLARQALKETEGNMERAVDWLFSHPDAQGDFGEDETAPGEQTITNKDFPGSESLPAKFELQSIVCHKGNSIHAGHYVAFVRKRILGDSQTSWVLFNDEKVAQAADVDEMKKFAYIYFFRRI